MSSKGGDGRAGAASVKTGVHPELCKSAAPLLAALCLLGGRPEVRADGPIGPDVIVGGVAISNDISIYGPQNGIVAYAFRTDSCNIGDAEVLWIANTNEHPAICQNMFRLKDGRFEQIGQAWMKHGFCAINNTLCGPCQATPCDTLGIGCSDPYSSGLNAQQGNMGPKSFVNASTGVFPYPSPNIPGPSPLLNRRLQVHTSDLSSTGNPNALYFLEAQYVTQDDAAAGNAANNASWRQVTVNSVSYYPTPVGPTNQTEPAIFAWQANDPQVTLTEVMIPDDGAPGFPGWFWVAGKAKDIGSGLWRYEYAVQNLNSDRSGGTFVVPLPRCAGVENIGFHDVDYHSGELVENTDWVATLETYSVRWECDEFYGNQEANALRWGTLYNFRFDARVPPVQNGTVELRLWKPGTPESVSVAMMAPDTACPCPGNLQCDDGVDGADLGVFLEMVLGHEAVDVCADLAAPFDRVLDMSDVTAFVQLLLETPRCVDAALVSSAPAHNKTLWRTQNNVLRLTFDYDIPTPLPGNILIQSLWGEEYGPDLSPGFTFTVEADDQGKPRVLKIRENGAVLTPGTWYVFRDNGTWPNVEDFSIELATQIGDTNNDDWVTTPDVSSIDEAVPTFNVADDDRRDVNGDGHILNVDVSIADSRNPSTPVPRPAGG